MTKVLDGMQAIVTRYHGPTNARGSRVSATAQAGRVFVEWDLSHNSEWNHRAAAYALMKRFGWDGDLFMGGLPREGNVFVIVKFGK